MVSDECDSSRFEVWNPLEGRLIKEKAHDFQVFACR